MKEFLSLLLPSLLQTLTGKPRYRPDIQWDKRIWIANIFRLHEYIWGRQIGIKKESSTTVGYVNGELLVVKEFYTVEALLAHIESTIRGYFSLFYSFFFNPKSTINYKPVYIGLSILGFIFSLKTKIHFLPLFGLAIALDTSATSTDQTASPLTWNHTVTGSNVLLAVGVVGTDLASQVTATGVTYNSVAMTQARQTQQTVATTIFTEASAWLLSAPTTGTNQVAVTLTFGNTQHFGGNSVSYSGAKQTSTADAAGGTSASGSSTGSKTFTVTVVAANSWIYSIGLNVGVFSTTITANATSRGTLTLSGASENILRAQDTNAAVSAGANTVGFTIGSGSESGYSFAGASFAPFVSTIPNVVVMIKQAVNRASTF